ncbi:DUF502 domain-containing protein [Candidatus Dependentiae bacterium]
MIRSLWEGIKAIVHYIKSLFMAGIFTLLPLAVTALVVKFFYGISYGLLAPFDYIDLLLMGSAILLVGLLGRFIITRAIINPIERLIKRIPILGAFYSGIKTMVDFFNVSGHPERKRQAVLIPYPKDDFYSVAFVVGPADKDFQSLLPGQNPENKDKIMKVFIPTTHVHFGFFTLIPESKIIYTDIKLEEAVKTILSCGIIVPASLRKKKITHQEQKPLADEKTNQ